jgi:hypothetical protein
MQRIVIDANALRRRLFMKSARLIVLILAAVQTAASLAGAPANHATKASMPS